MQNQCHKIKKMDLHPVYKGAIRFVGDETSILKLSRIFHETAQLDIEPVILCSIPTIRAQQRLKSGTIDLKKLNFCCDS
jgi:hypothetical protein